MIYFFSYRSASLPKNGIQNVRENANAANTTPIQNGDAPRVSAYTERMGTTMPIPTSEIKTDSESTNKMRVFLAGDIGLGIMGAQSFTEISRYYWCIYIVRQSDSPILPCTPTPWIGYYTFSPLSLPSNPTNTQLLRYAYF